MSLTSLIRKKASATTATAIPAIFATQSGEISGTVARIATVAVANAADENTANLSQLLVDAPPAPPSQDWLIRFAEQNPLAVAVCPAVDHAVGLALYPDSLTAEPFEQISRKPGAAMSDHDTATVMAFLAQIGESDPAITADVLIRCAEDAETQAYFVARGAAAQAPVDHDDRRSCTQCGNLQGRTCRAAKLGGVVSAQCGYQPVQEFLHRCRDYSPNILDADRRPGRERWAASF